MAKKNMSRFSDEAKEEDLQRIYEEIEEGKSPQESTGLDKTTIEGIYGHAYRLYNAGQYREAIQIFRILITFNSTNIRYILGLAACYHMLENYESALTMYSVVETVDPQNPQTYYDASNCYSKLNLPKQALEQLQSALQRCAEPKHAQLKERIQLAIASFTKE